MTWTRDLPLTAPAVGWLFGLLLVALIVVVLWPRLRLLPLAVTTLLAVALVAVGRHFLPASVDVARIPGRIYLWAVVLLTLVGVVGARWRSLDRSRRLTGLGALILACLLTAQQANAWFAYYPTLADLVGAPLPGQVTMAQLRAAQGDGRRFPHGALVSVDLPATSSRFQHRAAMVWLPPAALAGPAPGAQAADAAGLPVVMLLAGTPGRPDDMVRSADFATVAARYAAGHRGVAPVLVMPDHNGGFLADSECVGVGGRAEGYLTGDVPSALGALFGTPARGWGIIGYSEGGTCALVLALRHPDLFPVFVDIGGDAHPNLGSTPARDQLMRRVFYDGSVAAYEHHDPRHLLAHGRFPGIQGWFIAGRADPAALRVDDVLVPAARRAGIDVVATTPAGHHSFSLVKAVSDQTLSWVVARLSVPEATRGPGPIHVESIRP